MTGDDVFNVSATSVQAGANNSSRVFINGSRSMYNVFQLDGVDFTGGNYEASARALPSSGFNPGGFGAYDRFQGRVRRRNINV